MKIKKINRGALNVFLIFLFLIGIPSFNINQDWATALVQGIVAGFISAFIYIVGYLNGFKEKKGG